VKGAWTVIVSSKQQHISPTSSIVHCKGRCLTFGELEVDYFWYKGSLSERIILSNSLQAVLFEVGEADITTCTDV